MFELSGNGVLETITLSDTESDLVRQISAYHIVNDSERVLLAEYIITFGQDDDLPEPAFMNNLRAIEGTRSITVVREANTANETTFTFEVPTGVLLMLPSREQYEFYTDAEYTVIHAPSYDDLPDVTRLYMRRVE